MLKHNYWYGSRAGARAIRDKCEQSLNNHGNDCKDVPSRSCTLSRQWRNLSNFLPLNLCDAANGDFSKTLKASVRNVYCWFTNSCFGDWELPNVKSFEAIFSWSPKHDYHYGEFPKHKCPKASYLQYIKTLTSFRGFMVIFNSWITRSVRNAALLWPLPYANVSPRCRTHCVIIRLAPKCPILKRQLS